MTEQRKESTKLLVIGEGSDGRRRFDQASKRELIEACLRPDVSIAAMALTHGVNANLLRKWIDQYRSRHEVHGGKQTEVGQVEKSSRAFIPVMEMKLPVQTSSLRLGAELPNGVKIELSGFGSNELSTLLQTLCAMPCSD
jgi:transposase